MQRIFLSGLLSLFMLLHTPARAQSLESFLADPAFTPASIGICITDVATGETLVSHNDRQAIIPASTVKVITSATALRLLGSDYRTSTTVGYTGQIDSAGTLHGTLVIRGGGDPSLGSAYGSRPVSFTTDCICGFPGETPEDFAESCDFLKKIGFLKVHVFPYSRRSGTPAYDFPGQIHERDKQERSRAMNAAAEAIRKEVLAGYEGMEDDVLLETPLSETLFTGYTRLYVPVVVSAPGHASGEIVRVRLGAYDGERVRAALV